VQQTFNRLGLKGSKESANDSEDDNIELQNRKNIEKFNAFRVGSSTWARTRDLRIFNLLSDGYEP